MNFQKIFEEGWNNTIQHIGPVIILALAYLVLMMVSFGILAPVLTAGFTSSLLQAKRTGRTPQVGDLFGEMALFFPLLIFGLVMVVVLSIGYALLFIPGMLMTLAIAFGFLYIIPLMVDKDMGVVESVKASWAMSIEKPVTDQIIVAVVYAGIISLGGSVFIGFIFAQPLATFILVSAYDEKIGFAGEIEDDAPPSIPPEIPEDEEQKS